MRKTWNGPDWWKKAPLKATSAQTGLSAPLNTLGMLHFALERLVYAPPKWMENNVCDFGLQSEFREVKIWVKIQNKHRGDNKWHTKRKTGQCSRRIKK